MLGEAGECSGTGLGEERREVHPFVGLALLTAEHYELHQLQGAVVPFEPSGSDEQASATSAKSDACASPLRM